MTNPIKNEKQDNDAIARMYLLMQQALKPDSPNFEELDSLSLQVKQYDAERPAVKKPKAAKKTVSR